MHGNLQSVIQIFVRVVFRSIGREKKHLYFLLTLFQPGRDKLAMMNLQIVQNQEHFPLRAADQTSQEADETLLVHGVLVDHEADFPLTIDSRNHIHPLPLRLCWQHGRTALGRKAALHDFTVAYPCFICPIDVGILCLCSLCNGRVVFTYPLLNAFWILFPRTLRRALAAHPPALHVVR